MTVRVLFVLVIIAVSSDVLGTEIVFCSGFEACTVQQCGNGQLEDPELCDDGNNVNGDGCSANCQSLEVCGNLVTDLAAGEGCDDGNISGGDGCSAECQPEYCGNSHLDVGEMCDDGNSVGGDGCSANCQSNETCGNTIVDIAIGERCDDGNNTSGDGCSASCQPEYCGSSIVDAGEACDDGNNIGGDGCSANCLSDETCGNGIVDLVKWEECDDGNAENGDGCSDACVAECVDGSSRTCSVETGLGICTGTQVCVLGAWAECGFEAEVCDYVDNDCDGTIDEDFVVDGKYVSDEHCGGCGFDCTGRFPNANSFCEASASPACSFACSDGFVDLNGLAADGCETGIDADGIYVSTQSGSDSGSCGDILEPCATIEHGKSQAIANGKNSLHVAEGVYASVTIHDGLSLLGGYDPVTWVRNTEANQTIIRNDGSDPFNRSVIAAGIVSPTQFTGFIVEGRDSSELGGSSYAIWIRDSQSGLTISNNVIRAGDGEDGVRGSAGSSGENGTLGSNGVDSVDVGQDACGPSDHTAGGAGGSLLCAGTSTDGGWGGDRECPSFDGSTTEPPVASEAGTNGSNGGGAAGAAGWDVYQQISGCTGYLIFGTPDATSGMRGQDGSAGEAGAGCVDSAGLVNVSTGLWVPGTAEDGSLADSGGGGGGGGSGAGASVHSSCLASGFGYDNLGGTGGGGGAGGCRGGGGTKGQTGGGSFAIFVSYSTVTSSVPTINGNEIQTSRGGNGGDGGAGGPGGFGGEGGNGGAGILQVGPDNLRYPSYPGGDGGAGGDGGPGGGGGGGCGGASFGIFVDPGISPALFESWKTQNDFVPVGAPGNGGVGGISYGNPGGNGATGASGDTNY